MILINTKAQNYFKSEINYQSYLERRLGEPESAKVQAVGIAPTNPVLPPNSFVTQLTIFYVQRTNPTLEDYSSLQLRCLLEGVWGYFIGGARLPMGPWIHGMT